MKDYLEKFIRKNSPDGGFLQSEEWRKFQESTGKRVFLIEREDFYASIIEHSLPLVGRYFYAPRGPVARISNFEFRISKEIKNSKTEIKNGMQELVELAKENKAGWVRIEPAMEEILDEIGKNIKNKIVKAPHDVQPKEIFVIDIAKSEEELLAEMKSKTRYNIRLAEKKGVKIFNFQFSIFNECSNSNDQFTNKNNKYIEEFIRLVKVTAERDGIISHPENYYRKMFETIPGNILKLYIAEYSGQVIAANLVLFYGGTCTYMHGASDNSHRNVMAPYLLQWRQIQDARAAGCKKYDFGGVKTDESGSWSGITRFKTGFSPSAKAALFPGSYDIVIDGRKYFLYKLMSMAAKMKRHLGR